MLTVAWLTKKLIIHRIGVGFYLSMQCLLCKRNYSSRESYGEATYSEEIGVAYVVLFSQNFTTELRNMIQNNGLCDRRETEYKSGALSLYTSSLFISGRCRITAGIFDDILTNRRHGVDCCDSAWTSKYVEGKKIGLIWYKIQVFAMFDIWRKTTNGLSIVGLLAEFLTMDLQNTKQGGLPRDHNLLWVGTGQSLLLCVRF